MSDLHARLSCSNHRWPHCAGSVREEANYPDVAGAAAIEGTGDHILLENCLLNHVRADAYDGQILGVNHHDNPMGWLISHDRIERVQMCLDYITRRHGELSKKYRGADIAITSETKSNPGGAFGRTDWWGTVDITIEVVLDGRCVFLEIVDYKGGRGWVSEKSNSQLISYAFGKARPWIASGPDLVRPFRSEGVRDGVRMTIVQPRTNPVIRYEDQRTGWLINEAGNLATAAHKTDKPDAPLTAGKHCQWCKASMKRGGHCSIAAQESLEAIKMFDVTPSTPDESGDLITELQALATDLTQVPADKLSKLLDARDALNAAFDRLESEIERRLDTGETVPGYALKPGRASRVWNADEEELVKALKSRRLKRDDMYPPKLLSPAQFEKLPLDAKVKDRFLEKYCSTKAGKLKVTKVAHGEEKESLFKDVAQSTTTVLQSENTNEVSFF